MHLTEVSNAQIKQEYIFPANPGFIYTPDNQWRIAADQQTPVASIEVGKFRWSLFTKFPVVSIIYSTYEDPIPFAKVCGWPDHDAMGVMIQAYFGSLKKLVEAMSDRAALPDGLLCANLKDGRSLYVVTGKTIQQALESSVYLISSQIH
jgi:hypothetical protein